MLVVKAQQIKILILIFFKLRKETWKRGGELGVVGLCWCGGSYYGIIFLISPNQLLANKQLNRKLIKVTLGWLMV